MRPRSARIRPSPSSASSTDARCPRPCGAHSRFSRRSSIHLTGRPSSTAASATSGRLDRQRSLGAERAADVGDDHADQLLRDPEDLRELRPWAMRALRGGPDRQAPVGGFGERAAGLDRGRHQARDHVVGAHDVGGARERALDVPRPLLPARELRSRARVEHRRQDLVVDLDAVGGVLGFGARLAHHDRDRLADVGDLVAREHRVRRVGDGQTGRRVHPRRPARPAMSAAVQSAPRTPSAPGRARAGCARTPCAASHRAGCRRGIRVPGEDPLVLATADRPADRPRGAHGVEPGTVESCGPQ